MSADTLLARLDRVKPSGRDRWRGACPACDSETGLAIAETADGRTLVHCFAGCDVEQVLGAVGLDFDALYPPRGPGSHHWAPRERKPWRASEVFEALQFELAVGLIVLSDVAQGKPVDRQRAGDAALRIARFSGELFNARR